MYDDNTVTLEIGADAIVVEADGVRAEIRGAEVASIKERLAEVAIELIREAGRQRRYEREMAAAHTQMENQRAIGGAASLQDLARASVQYRNRF